MKSRHGGILNEKPQNPKLSRRWWPFNFNLSDEKPLDHEGHEGLQIPAISFVYLRELRGLEFRKPRHHSRRSTLADFSESA